MQTSNFTFSPFTKILLGSPILQKFSQAYIHSFASRKFSKTNYATAFQRDKSRRFSETNYTTAFQRDKSGRFSKTNYMLHNA